jgi:hypothetical protein
MNQDLFPDHRGTVHYAPPPRRARGVPVSAALVLVVLVGLVVIATSIGIVQAETLSAMVADEDWRLALLGLVSGIVVIGGITAVVMWLTAPAPVRTPAPMRVASFHRPSRRPF